MVLHIRLDKCAGYSPVSPSSTLFAAGLPSTVPVSSDGLVLLGAPIGSDSFITQHCSQFIASVIADCRTPALFNSRHLDFLISQKSTRHRITFLLRAVPFFAFPDLLDQLHGLDIAFRKVIDRSCFTRVSDIGWAVAQLSPNRGGPGLPQPSSFAHHAFLHYTVQP